MKLIYLLLKLFYINRTAYAINEYNYIDKGNSKYNSDYYRIEKVIVKEIFFNTNEITYIVTDIVLDEDWGDTIEHVYFSKRKATKELLKLCKI